MYEQITIFDIKETVDDWVNKIIELDPEGFYCSFKESLTIESRSDFFRIKVTLDQVERLPYCDHIIRHTDRPEHESWYIQILHSGKHKGECMVGALGCRVGSMWLNNADKGSDNLINGLKKVYEVLNETLCNL